MEKNYLTEEYLFAVADAVLIDEATGIQLATCSLKSHNVAQTVDTTEIKAGQENDTLVTIKSNKNLTVELEDVRQSRQWLAMQMGSTIEANEDVIAYAFPKFYTVDENLEITLEHTPEPNQVIRVYNRDTKEVLVSHATVDTTITLPEEKANEGDIVVVESYKYKINAGKAEVLHIKSNKFAKSYRLILDELVFDNDYEVVGRRQTIFYKVTADDAFTLAGSTERSEQTNTYKFTVKKHPSYDDLGVIVYHNEAK